MAEKKMFCPLANNGELEFDCLEWQCAWWMPDEKKCAIVVLAKELPLQMANIEKAIREKMVRNSIGNAE